MRRRRRRRARRLGGRDVNERQWGTFVRVVDAGSFARAARQGYVTAQSVAQQIDRLEQEVGVRLLERSPHGVRTTDAGRIFYQGIVEVGDRLNALLAQCRAAGHPQAGLVRVGSSDSYSLDLFSQVMHEFLRMYPGIDVDFVEVGEDPVADLESGVYDVLESIEPDSERELIGRGLAFEPLTSEQRCCLVSPRNPLSHEESVAPADLRGMTVVVFNMRWTARLRSYLDQRCPGLQFREMVRGERMGMPPETDLATSVTLVPERLAGRYTNLIAVPLECPLTCHYGLLFRRRDCERLEPLLGVARRAFGADGAPS